MVYLPLWKIWVCQLGSFFPTEWNIKFHGSKAPSSTQPARVRDDFSTFHAHLKEGAIQILQPVEHGLHRNRGTVEPGRPLGEPRPKHVDVANVAATIHHSVHVQVLHQPGAANVVWCVTSSHEGKINGYWSKPWHLVNPKIAGKWMFIPLELIIIGFDPPPNTSRCVGHQNLANQKNWNKLGWENSLKLAKSSPTKIVAYPKISYP